MCGLSFFSLMRVSYAGVILAYPVDILPVLSGVSVRVTFRCQLIRCQCLCVSLCAPPQPASEILF